MDTVLEMDTSTYIHILMREYGYTNLYFPAL